MKSINQNLFPALNYIARHFFKQNKQSRAYARLNITKRAAAWETSSTRPFSVGLLR